jgi:hypothetical protein
MKPVIKKGRRFRGLEVAQAALLLVLGVVVALVMYFLMMDIVQTTPVPVVQLDAYNSYITGSKAYVTLKFAKPGSLKDMHIIDSSDTRLSISCDYGSQNVWDAYLNNQPIRVNPGKQYLFSCGLLPDKNWSDSLIVVVEFIDGSKFFARWVIR